MDVLQTMPKLLTEVAHACRDAGGRAMLVGGCVRDAMLGRAVKDWDVEVYRLRQDELERVLRTVGRVNAVGKAFGVFKLHRGQVELDVSMPRRDSNVGPGHKGIAVQGDPNMSVIEAARRRDLTINALLIDLHTGQLEDPFDGRADLLARRLRAVDQTTFLEDPLRALRAVQFAARLGFEPDDELVALCTTAALDELPAERIQGEWRKLLLKGSELSRGFALARRAGILERVFPALSDDEATDALLDRCVPLRNQLQGEGRRWSLMLSAWLRDCAPDAVEMVLDRLWLHRVQGYAVRERVHAAVAHWRDPIGTDAELRWLSTRAEVQTVLLLRQAVGESVAGQLERAVELNVLHSKPEPLLKGRHLKGRVKPGPQMGKLLKGVYEAQLDGRVHTLDEAIALVP